MSRNRGWINRPHPHGLEAGETQTEFVPRTEHEEARRAARDWLRERSEDDVPEWGDELERM